MHSSAFLVTGFFILSSGRGRCFAYSLEGSCCSQLPSQQSNVTALISAVGPQFPHHWYKYNMVIKLAIFSYRYKNKLNPSYCLEVPFRRLEVCRTHLENL